MNPDDFALLMGEAFEVDGLTIDDARRLRTRASKLQADEARKLFRLKKQRGGDGVLSFGSEWHRLGVEIGRTQHRIDILKSFEALYHGVFLDLHESRR